MAVFDRKNVQWILVSDTEKGLKVAQLLTNYLI